MIAPTMLALLVAAPLSLAGPIYAGHSPCYTFTD